MLQEEEVWFLGRARAPFWIFDIDKAQIPWANDAALELWSAASNEELSARDMGEGMTSAVRSRLKQYQAEFPAGKQFDESWTVYPKGQATTVLCRFRGCQLKDGRVAMLCEAQHVAERSHEVLRGSQALLYTGAMVSTYSMDGACIYANPAALRAFSSDGLNLHKRLIDKDVVQLILSENQHAATRRFISEVKSGWGTRIHEIEVTSSFDALTGERTLLFTEVDVTEKERAKHVVERLANTDSLTGLYNRNYLSENADSFIRDQLRKGRSVHLGLFDLDRFKFVNDSHGHEVGDALLQHAAELLNQHFGEDVILGRLGGDEFCILAGSNHGTGPILRTLRKFQRNFGKQLLLHGRLIRSGASFGMDNIKASQECRGFDSMLRNADLALYEAKSLGGNKICQFRPSLARKRHRFTNVETELEYALNHADSGFELNFQPKVDLERQCISGAEVLARLTDRSGKRVSPVEFIPIAESTGLIHDLGQRVIEDAADYLNRFKDMDMEMPLSVNVSPSQFQGSRLMTQLRNLAGTSGFDPTLMELELTETALHLGDSEFQRKMMEIVELGFPLSIDDFGTAYSNIARLNDYPISCIKFDKSLISEKNNDVLAKVVINIGRALNLRVVAEGVETEQQRDWLLENGCCEHQGYLYAEPGRFDKVPWFEIEQRLEQPNYQGTLFDNRRRVNEPVPFRQIRT